MFKQVFVGSCNSDIVAKFISHEHYVLKLALKENMTRLWLHQIIFIQLPFSPCSPIPSVQIVFSINILTPNYSNIFLLGEHVYFGPFSSYWRVIMVMGLTRLLRYHVPLQAPFVFISFYGCFSKNFAQHFILVKYTYWYSEVSNQSLARSPKQNV